MCWGIESERGREKGWEIRNKKIKSIEDNGTRRGSSFGVYQWMGIYYDASRTNNRVHFVSLLVVTIRKGRAQLLPSDPPSWLCRDVLLSFHKEAWGRKKRRRSTNLFLSSPVGKKTGMKRQKHNKDEVRRKEEEAEAKEEGAFARKVERKDVSEIKDSEQAKRANSTPSSCFSSLLLYLSHQHSSTCLHTIRFEFHRGNLKKKNPIMVSQNNKTF